MEINIRNATRYYQDQFQIIGNKDENQNDDIGILTLIKKGTPIKENILGENGRIIGTKLSECQIWNVYPPSGANFKSQREIFFREDLIHLMMNWKDQTRYIIQIGDHNCTHRDQDSVNINKLG